MVKTLLSFVLVATQALSWNASPLYLCLSADGSICLDFGSANCGGCRHDAADGASCAADACPHDGHHACTPATAADVDPCGCEHIQISEPQAATLARTAAAPDSPRWEVPPTAAPADGARGCSLFAAQSARASCPLDTPSPALVSLASVVMRC